MVYKRWNFCEKLKDRIFCVYLFATTIATLNIVDNIHSITTARDNTIIHLLKCNHLYSSSSSGVCSHGDVFHPITGWAVECPVSEVCVIHYVTIRLGVCTCVIHYVTIRLGVCTCAVWPTTYHITLVVLVLLGCGAGSTILHH